MLTLALAFSAVMCMSPAHLITVDGKAIASPTDAAFEEANDQLLPSADRAQHQEIFIDISDTPNSITRRTYAYGYQPPSAYGNVGWYGHDPR
jgi:hypothetical protein